MGTAFDELKNIKPSKKQKAELLDKVVLYFVLHLQQFKPPKSTEILNEILRDIKNYELEFRIAELESKFSKDLSEATFNELKELKKQQKIN